MIYTITHSGITSMAVIKGYIEAACVLNGWTLTGGWLIKGECEIRLTQRTGTITFTGPDIRPYDELMLEQRTPSGTVCVRPSFIRVSTFSGIDCSINIHICDNPDTVWITAKANTDTFFHMGFGYIQKFSIWKGGCWIHGAQGEHLGHFGELATNNWATLTAAGTASSDNNNVTDNLGVAFPPSPKHCGPFWQSTDSQQTYGTAKFTNSFIHCELRGRTFEYDGRGEGSIGYTDGILSTSLFGGLTATGDNDFNSQTILYNFMLALNNASGVPVPIGIIEHIRFVRMNNYLPEDIIEVGSEKWKVYPFSRRDITYPNGKSPTPSDYIVSTGLLGLAVRVPV